jgi:acetoin utilization deacetylase AcuC-like enzyme
MILPRVILRRLTRFLRSRTGRSVRFFYHPAYRRGLTGVPMDALRGERVLTWLEGAGWLSPNDFQIPEEASLQSLLRVHTPEYLRSLERTETVSQILGLPLKEEEAQAALTMQRIAAGGTLEAARFALASGGIGFHLGGGFHHARVDRGGGFCLLNDVAIAIRALREEGFGLPVLVVDLDLHDGDGTRSVFAQDPSVHTYSIHNQTWLDVDAVADTCLAVGAGLTDAVLMETLEATLPQLLESLKPGLIVYLAGVDAMAGDAFGDGAVTSRGMTRRDLLVVNLFRGQTPPIPMVVVLSGGYGPRAWRPTGRFAAWLCSGQIIEPPHDVDVALDRALRVWHADATAPDQGRARAETRPADPFSWSLEPDDLVGLGGVEVPSEPTLLGRLSHAEVQVALERFGILPQLRNRGYAHPLVEMVAGSGLGPVVRVWGEGEREHLLVEIRLEVDRGSLPGHPLLRVEWLLLQDPRAQFTPLRPPLPGQDHPGLGALADVMAWLVYLCQSTALDGILFRTPHWHLAVLAHRHVHFLTEAHAAQFDAGVQAMGHRSLAEVAQMPEIYGWSGEIPLILPVGDRLKGQTHTPATRMAALPPRTTRRKAKPSPSAKPRNRRR